MGCGLEDEVEDEADGFPFGREGRDLPFVADDEEVEDCVGLDGTGLELLLELGGVGRGLADSGGTPFLTTFLGG